MSAQLEDSAYMFDAVWAAALALNNTNDSLVNFMYNSQEAANISQSIHNNMIDLNFFGLTVSVHVSTHVYLVVKIYASLNLIYFIL